MSKERTYFEVYEELKKDPKKHSESFCESYKNCYFINRLDGKVFKGTWCGYAIKPEGDNKEYFTNEGIRGSYSGLFAVINGEVHEVEDLNENSFKDKYKEFVRDIWKYIELKMKSLEELEKIPELSSDTKVQVSEHKNTLYTLLQLFNKY